MSICTLPLQETLDIFFYQFLRLDLNVHKMVNKILEFLRLLKKKKIP